MSAAVSPDLLWDPAPQHPDVFDPAMVAQLPAGAQRYLAHAIAPGTPLASAVRLRMHGEIKLNRWLPFEAEQVLSLKRGFVWRATVRMGVIRVTGFDSLVDGLAHMRWKLLGMVPIVSASGPDIDRSAEGRFAAECVWLPAALLSPTARWHTAGPDDARAVLQVGNRSHDVSLTLHPSGALHRVSLERWGTPEDGKGFALREFGAVVEDERTFGGYTIPSQLRVGWDVGSERFSAEGEFFRCRIDAAEFR